MKMQFLLLTTLVAFAFTGCLTDKCERTHTYVRYDAVYKLPEEMRVPVERSAPRELVDPGKIYYYNGYLLINERREGVHIIDNSNPASPENIAFLEIPGNLDMAVKDNVLYVDMYLDLVAVDISDPLNAVEIGRTNDVFNEYYPLIDGSYIVEYVPTTETIELDCSDAQFGSPWFWRGPILFANVDMAFAESSGSWSAPGGTGIGGSMARFTIAKDHLYALDEARMRVFNIDQPNPVLANTVDVSWGIETLFPYGDYLFIGANAGMFIFDNSVPESPTYLAEFVHARACDPVFVTEDVAYVTLRDGNTCENFTNQLEVIDVSDISNPDLIATHPMHNPHGLSVVDQTLYLCEGDEGLKVFSTTDLERIGQNQLDHIRNMHGYDVIVLPPGDLVMVIGQDGLYQYDASDRSDLRELSKITVNRQ